MKGTSSTRLPSHLGLVVGGEHVLADSENDRDITADLNLMVLAADHGFLAGQHLGGILRIDEGFQALFPDRIEGDDRYASFSRFLQRMEEAGAVRARILAKEKHCVAFGEVIEYRGPDADADRLFQSHARGLVAHVG